MKNRIDNILLGLLWLLAISLGASFWFNVKFGFNIFSAAHWQYLGHMQANQMPVRSSFYFSLVMMVVVMLAGLYILVRPRLRRIRFIKKTPPTKTPPQKPTQEQNTATVTTDAPTAQKTVTTAPAMVRPMRPNMPRISNNAQMPGTTASTPTVTTPPINTQANENEIRQIFESAGYTVKGAPRINKQKTSVVAIAPNEVLWIGATGISTTDMVNKVNKLNNVFSDTLEDVEIHINAFVISPTDANDANDENILTFTDVNALREYISAHPVAPATPDEEENFDAYSAYISTVIDYIGKI